MPVSAKLRATEIIDGATFSRTTVTPAVRQSCTDEERQPLTAWALEDSGLLVQVGAPGRGRNDRARRGGLGDDSFAVVHASGFRVWSTWRAASFDDTARVALALVATVPGGWWTRSLDRIQADIKAQTPEVKAIQDVLADA